LPKLLRPKKKRARKFDVIEHVHRFAAWAASTAARQGMHKLKGKVGLQIIENVHLDKVLRGGLRHFHHKKSVDKWHKEMRKRIICEADDLGLKLSHGVAAKLVNVYLKAGFVTIANKDDKEVGHLHPPIDHAVLKGMESGDSKFPRGLRWSKLNSEQYQAVIDNVRTQLGDEKRLWMIERYFEGYQG
jgi:hypothetical protein